MGLLEDVKINRNLTFEFQVESPDFEAYLRKKVDPEKESIGGRILYSFSSLFSNTGNELFGVVGSDSF